jgi:chromosome segregation ATPase
VRLLGLFPALLLAFLLGQARTPRTPRGRADAGPVLLGTDPPGRLRPAPATDAGAIAQQDGGLDDVHRELQQLRARLEALERERAQAQENAQRLQQLVDDVHQLRQQIADAEAQRQAAEQERQTRRASVQSAVDALYGAQQRLAGGNSSIEAELDQAQSSFTGQAQRDIEAARAALRNHDLSTARALLSAAISDAQAGR